MTKLNSPDSRKSDLLKRAVELKSKLSKNAPNIDDNVTLIVRQQLRSILMKVILDDLVFALDNKLEQDLWNFVFKAPISVMQATAKDKKHPDYKQSAAVLNAFLDSALGFYTLLLKKITLVYKIDLDFMPRHNIGHILTNDRTPHQTSSSSSLVLSNPSPDSQSPTIVPSDSVVRTNAQSGVTHCCPPSGVANGVDGGGSDSDVGGAALYLSSCHCLVQDCLVRMGDLARYRSKPHMAETLYRHALHLAPSSGQPYNQLALLATQYGDRISPLYYYIRSVTVRTPFVAGAQNLSRLYSRLASKSTQLSLDNTEFLSSSEYILLFLQLHARVYQLAESSCSTAGSWCTAACGVLVQQLPRLLLEEAFTALQLVQMLVVSVYGVHQTTLPSFTTPAKPAATNSLAAEQLLQLVCHTVCGLLRVTYRLRELERLRQYVGLAAVKLYLSWLLQSDNLLSLPVFSAVNCPIWPLLSHLANRLSNNSIGGEEREDGDDSLYILPEDEELCSFSLIPGSSSASSSSPLSIRPSPALVPLYRCRQLLKLCHQLKERNYLMHVQSGSAGTFSCHRAQLGEERLVLQQLQQQLTNTPTTTSLTPDSSVYDVDSSVKQIVGLSLMGDRASTQLTYDQTVVGHGILKHHKPVSAIGSGWRRSQNVAMETIFRGIDIKQPSATDSHCDTGRGKQVKFSTGSSLYEPYSTSHSIPLPQAVNSPSSDAPTSSQKRRFSPPPRFKQQHQHHVTATPPPPPATFNPSVPPPLTSLWSHDQKEAGGQQAVSMLASGDAASTALYSLFPPVAPSSSQTFWPMAGPSPLETLIQQQQQQQKRRDNSLNPL